MYILNYAVEWRMNMGFPLSEKKRRVAWIALLLCLVLALSVVVVFGNQEDPYAPAVDIRHEAVTYHNGFQIYRMVVSARAPNGFSLFGIVISYDNNIIQPVHSAYYTDIPVPSNTTVRPGSIYPFYTLVTGFIEAPNAWLVQDGRTGFSFDLFSLGDGVASDEMTDIFALYYRAHANNIEAAPEAFRIEDGRAENSMVGTDTQLSFVRSGIILRSGETTYVWGAASENNSYSLIPDWNIAGFDGEVLAPEYDDQDPEYDYDQDETPTPAPDPTPTPEPGSNPTSTPEPSPSASPNPSSAPSASSTPAPSSAPSTSSTPAPSTTPSATPAPCPSTTPAPCPSTTPSPTPCPTGNRPNPVTSPIGTGFVIFSAVVFTGIAFTGLLTITKKHKANADSYNTAITRHNREKRLTDILDEE